MGSLHKNTQSSACLGVFFSELLHNFERFRSGEETHKLRFYVGHDGTMIRLAAGLGLGHASNGGALRWPAMGSEIIMEVSEHRGLVTPRDLSGRCGAIRTVGDSFVFYMRVLPCRAFDGSNWESLSICSTVSYQKISTEHALNNNGLVYVLTANNPGACIRSLTTSSYDASSVVG
jgi:hypothetical protein